MDIKLRILVEPKKEVHDVTLAIKGNIVKEGFLMKKGHMRRN